MNEILREKLEKLPDSPGCYLMRDEDGTVIYVGKAVNLKNRVRSYFRGSHDPKTQLLVENIVDFDTVVVDNEAEALILEANLIKEHAPHYNILLRDDKHYPYIRVTMEEKFPRLLVARRARHDGSRYFGPYPAVGGIHKAIETIQEVFPLRTCAGFKTGQRPCLNSHIHRCLAPCTGQVSQEEYGRVVEQVILFLQGRSKQLIRQEQAAMEQASEELRYEDAARHRDRAAALAALQEKQQIDLAVGEGDYDLLAVAAGEDQAVVQLFRVRGGTVTGRDHFFLTNAQPGREAQMLTGFLMEYYGGGQLIPKQLLCQLLPESAEQVEDALSRDCGHRVDLSVPQRGPKKRLLDLTVSNAQLILGDTLRSKARQQMKSSKALEELRLVLGLERTPERIECYDISHVQGTYMVGSMVVFLRGAASPAHYRRFRIKTLTESNDFAALQEVIERRWRRGLTELEEGKQPPDFACFPDLLVIDGGKGQLSAVCARLDEMGVTWPAIISLAKQEEEVFLPGRHESLRLPYESEGLQLLQRLRDEAHRFAITYHRQLRGQGQTRSILDGAPGVGAARKKALLQTFGTLRRLQAASVEELATAPKMNAKAAETLYCYLHAAQRQTPAAEAPADREAPTQPTPEEERK